MQASPEPRGDIPATANIAGHPIHPMIMPLPLAFLLGVLGTDIGFLLTSDPFWARASLWLLGIGLLTGALAAVFGAVDFFTIRQAREHRAGWIHAVGNVAVMLLAFVSLVLRWEDAAEAVTPWGIMLSVVIVALLGVTGWFGGELAYRYRIGTFSKDASDEL